MHCYSKSPDHCRDSRCYLFPWLLLNPLSLSLSRETLMLPWEVRKVTRWVIQSTQVCVIVKIGALLVRNRAWKRKNPEVQ